MYTRKNKEGITIYNTANQIIDSLPIFYDSLMISPDNKYTALFSYTRNQTVIRDLNNHKDIELIKEYYFMHNSILSDEGKFYSGERHQLYAWNFLEANSHPILIFEIESQGEFCHILYIFYRNHKLYILHEHDPGYFLITIIDSNTLEKQNIDFAEPLKMHYSDDTGHNDRSIMTHDFKIIIINEPYLIMIDLRTKTWKEINFGKDVLMEISDDYFLIQKDYNLQMIEYDSMKIIKEFPLNFVSNHHKLYNIHSINYNLVIVNLLDYTETIADNESYLLDLRNGNIQKMSSGPNSFFYSNYQHRYLFLFDQIINLITSIRVLQQIAKYYQVAFDMVYEIIRQLLWNYKIKNRELANYLNTYTRSIGATKEEFQKNIARLLLSSY